MRISFFKNIGPDYLWRFRLIPILYWRGVKRYPPVNAFLHVFKRSDERTLHDHPWPSVSVLLRGNAWEVYYCDQQGVEVIRRIPRFRPIFRPAQWRHRLVIPRGESAVTLFCIGRKVRSWGFWPDNVFVPWWEHLKRDDTATID